MGLGINLGYIIIQALAFVILVLVVKGYAYEPILKILEERKARIAKGLEDARQAAIARDNADAEAKKILDAARAEAAQIRADAAGVAEKTAAEIVSKANADAKAKMASAAADADETRTQALAGLRGQVAAISIAAANKLVGESLDKKRQHQLLDDFFAKVPANVKDLSGDMAEVTSALPLNDDEKKAAKKAIKAGDVSFKVDPSILGGLIVRVGDQVVDNSVANQMSAMREAMQN